MMKKSIFFAVALLCGASLFAQEQETENPISAERPGAGSGTSVLAKKVFQIETGAQYQEFEFGNVKQKYWTYNTTLLRYGLLDNFEIRLSWDAQEIKTEVSGNEINDVMAGFTPLTAGFKIGIVEEKGILPQMAFIGNLFLPFAAATDFKSENTGGQMLLTFSNTLDAQSGITYNLGAQWSGDSSELSYVYAFSYGRSLVGDLSGFAEVYGTLPEDNQGQNSWDAGLSYLISNDFQVDASAGTGFDTDQNFFVNAGVSYRFN
ncbi:MAG TPA: transporter [Leeuwenhoekiella sp.]|nr:transporter [Leeuwenhoekiella sp.]